jgi:hypothetical protein
MLVNLPDAMTVHIWSLSSVWFKKYRILDLFKNILFSVWVPNSEERKPNPKKPYLGVLVRITESLYSGGSTPASGSASVYVRSGTTSYSVSGSESTISPILI